uniref:Putative plant transposon protein domain-containing protein n=1 Tax=Solanum tuberosum TaxID=4113 RepID=M1DM57_SOLTU
MPERGNRSKLVSRNVATNPIVMSERGNRSIFMPECGNPIQVPEVPNHEFETKIQEMDLEWLRDTLVEPTCRDQRWLHLVTKRIRPSGNRTDVTFPHALVVACTIQGIQLNVGAQIISEWKMFDRGNKKVFFLPSLSTALCKWAWVPLFDADEVLPMGPPIHPLLVRQGSTSRSKRGRTGRASSSKAAVDSDNEDPLSGAWVEEDLKAIRKKMGSSGADFTPVPPNTALEVEMLHCQLHRARHKGSERDRLMDRIWKTIKAIFSCVTQSRGLQGVPYVE